LQKFECLFVVQVFDFFVRIRGDACHTRFSPREKYPRT